MINPDSIIDELPDPESARRFLARLIEIHPAAAQKLERKNALFSDVLTLVAFSPLIAATLLQNPEYLWWLDRKRGENVVRNKDELLESLARFSLTNSQLDPHVLLARFRRRELMRIFLRDIRRLATIAEITEEISNLADAVLENALRIASQDLDNRYGSPLESDDKGRMRRSELCIVSLGKLGSRELNYSSDIDLLFIYSAEGKTSGSGTRDPLTNREYFIKLAEAVVKLVGDRSGEGAAYRVDLRLRPHGRVGPLAMSLADTVRYYKGEAAPWERQVLIRSRSSAGAQILFKRFASAVENSVFSTNDTIESALANVRRSKQLIDLEKATSKGLDVKLGRGGIREIEFVAQALQLAYGGQDKWLRSPHTLISLDRLADRKLLSDREYTELAEAYAFLRRLEHVLQMEHGLQTHLLPNDPEKRRLIGARLDFAEPTGFEEAVEHHTENVNRVFRRVFGDGDKSPMADSSEDAGLQTAVSEVGLEAATACLPEIDFAKDVSPRVAEMIAARPAIVNSVSFNADRSGDGHYSDRLRSAVSSESTFGGRLSALRTIWTEMIFEIAVLDATEKLDINESKRLQTVLAEASIETSLEITRHEVGNRFGYASAAGLSLAVMGLGKLGGGGVDYDSDLDLVMVCGDQAASSEMYSRAVEIFVNTLSAITRDGSLYRVDLRLRPHGKDGASFISRTAFADYMRNTAAIWEMLAFVKLRGVGGDIELARSVECEIRGVVHERAALMDHRELAAETAKVRSALEKKKRGFRRRGDIDIKYGPGGMLDIYFAIRFLQLRDDHRDDDKTRSSGAMLERLFQAGSLTAEDSGVLLDGYRFLSALDHNLRLVVGRTTRMPVSNTRALAHLARRMQFGSPEALIDELNLHRLSIRQSFDRILAETK